MCVSGDSASALYILCTSTKIGRLVSGNKSKRTKNREGMISRVRNIIVARRHGRAGVRVRRNRVSRRRVHHGPDGRPGAVGPVYENNRGRRYSFFVSAATEPHNGGARCSTETTDYSDGITSTTAASYTCFHRAASAIAFTAACSKKKLHCGFTSLRAAVL